MKVFDYDGLMWTHSDKLPCKKCYYDASRCKCGGVIHYQFEDEFEDGVSVSEHCTLCDNPAYAGDIE